MSAALSSAFWLSVVVVRATSAVDMSSLYCCHANIPQVADFPARIATRDPPPLTPLSSGPLFVRLFALYSPAKFIDLIRLYGLQAGPG